VDRQIPLQFLCSAVYFLCSAEKIPLFGGVAEFRLDSNQINHLESWNSACEGPEQAFFAVFSLEQGNPMTRMHGRNRHRPEPVLGRAQRAPMGRSD
jgi:hypothetical protein